MNSLSKFQFNQHLLLSMNGKNLQSTIRFEWGVHFFIYKKKKTQQKMRDVISFFLILYKLNKISNE